MQAAATIARKMHESLKTADAPTTVEEFQIKFNIFRLDSFHPRSARTRPLRDSHFNNNNKRDRGNSSHNNNNNNNNNKRGRGSGNNSTPLNFLAEKDIPSLSICLPTNSAVSMPR